MPQKSPRVKGHSLKHASVGIKPYCNKGNVDHLPRNVCVFVRHYINLCKPSGVYICDGSAPEGEDIIKPWVSHQIVHRLGIANSSILFHTDPRDTGRMFSKKFRLCTSTKKNPDSFLPPIEIKASGGISDNFLPPIEVKASGGISESPRGASSAEDVNGEAYGRFLNCMKGRTMFVLPFSLGAVGSPHHELGVMVTDCPFAYFSMKSTVRVVGIPWSLFAVPTADVTNCRFIKVVHSVGCPRPVKNFVRNHWPCNPEKALLAYQPGERKIKAFGSGVIDPPTFLFPLLNSMGMSGGDDKPPGRLVSTFSILGIKTPHGKEFFVAMARANCCDAMSLAEITPCIPGYDVKIIGSGRLTFMWVDENGVLRAANPMTGFSGTRHNADTKHNKLLLKALQFDTLFLNTAHTGDGQYYWEGLEDTISKDECLTNWLGLPWNKLDDNCDDGVLYRGDKVVNGPDDKVKNERPRRMRAAHSECRYYCPWSSKHPLAHPKWNDPQGVPISAIIFGSRRNDDTPLVYECKSWTHGILTGACLKSYLNWSQPSSSDTRFVHDPMVTNGCMMEGELGSYLQQWLDMETLFDKKEAPRIFHVDWWCRDTRDWSKSSADVTSWPGVEEYVRVMDWILRRCDNYPRIGVPSPVGILPRPGTINMKGIETVEMDRFLSAPPSFWLREIEDCRNFMKTKIGPSTPAALLQVAQGVEKEFLELQKQDPNRQLCSRPMTDRCYACIGPPMKKHAML